MASIRNRGNRSTEWRLRARLAASGLRGWRVYAADIYGKPDFVFDQKQVAIFVDGCFWHGCRKCRRVPATHKSFWTTKIEANRKRDRLVSRTLRKRGWTVIRLWEHQLRGNPRGCLIRIRETLGS